VEIIQHDKQIQTKAGKIPVKSGTLIIPTGGLNALCTPDFLSHYIPTDNFSGNQQKYIGTENICWAARLPHDCNILIQGKLVTVERGKYLIMDEAQFELSVAPPHEFNQTFMRLQDTNDVQTFLMLFGGVH
jgi:hypothetical protein